MLRVVMMFVSFGPHPSVFALHISVAVGAFPGPFLIMLNPAPSVSLIPLTVPLFRKHPVMVFCKGIAGVNTVLAIVMVT